MITGPRPVSTPCSSQSWKDLGSTDGVTYGVNYTYGDRSAIWYKKAHLEKAGIEPPKTWEEFIA